MSTTAEITHTVVVWVISVMVEKEPGERNVGFDSLKSRLNRYMEEEGAKSTSTCVEVHMSFLRRSVVPTSRRMRTSPAGGVPYDERSEQQSVGEMTRGRGEAAPPGGNMYLLIQKFYMLNWKYVKISEPCSEMFIAEGKC